METYIRFVLRRRWYVIAAVLIITAAAAAEMSRGVIASSIGDFLEESDQYASYLEHTREFANDEVMVIAYEEPDPLSAESINKLRGAVDALAGLPGVRRVRSILDARKIEVKDGAVSMDSYAERSLAGGDGAALAAELRSDPLAEGLLIAKDGRGALVVVELSPDKDRRTENYPDFVEQALGAFTEHGFARASLHRTGMIPVLAEVMRQSAVNIKRLFPLVCAALLLTIFVMFRRLWPVAITGLIALLSVIWSMGFAVLLFHQINLLMAMVPMFILIISFSDVVHLCSSYLLELSRGEAKENAILKSGTEVGAACFYTSVTTFIGFISLATVPTPISRQAGLVLGFGTAVALFLALTLTPVLFSVMKEPKPWRLGATARVQDALDALLGFLERLATGRPRLIVAAFTVLTALSVAGLMRFELETDFVQRFAADNQLMVDERFFSEHFAGTSYLDLYLESPEPGGLLTPEAFSRIAAFEKAVTDLPDVDKAVSAVDLVAAAHRGFHPEAGPDALPDTQKQIAQYLYLFEMDDEEALAAMIDSERRTMRMAAHIKEDGFMAADRAGQKVLEAAARTLGGGVKVEISGLQYIFGSEFNRVMAGQKRALVLAFLMISLMMAVALRSISAGMWSMIPNIIPLLMLGGYIGFSYGKIDTDAIIVFLVAIGIGVDDTIHYLMRFKLELARTGDRGKALAAAYHYSGRAMIITSVILIVGFAPFAVSDYFTTHIMGTLLPGCLLAALLADLLLVPAMITLGLFKFREPRGLGDLEER
ncbi:MAG TPA: MMPL family transporter [bacterium]|nr:MMPL family transporter [bacterium]